MAEEEAVRIEIDPRMLSAMLRELKAVRPKLATGMRREVRNAGGLVRDVAAAELLAYPANRYDTGMREALAASIVVRIMSSPKSPRQGVDVVSNGRLLPKNKRSLVKAMNRKTFHPRTYVGAPGSGHLVYREQPGARYFRPSTLETAKALMNARIAALMDQALADLART